MARRRGGGGGDGARSGSNNDRILRRHTDSAGKSYQTVEQLVDHLRSSYPHYARHKLRPFTEAQHMRRRNGDVSNDSGGLSSSSVASASSSGEEDSSEEEASTSVDAIYDEKFEPEFDLMKSLMRENLRGKTKKLGDGREVKESVELEVVDNKGVKDLCLINGEGKSDDVPRKINKNSNSGRDGSKVDGSMFKDSGGMGETIEQLKRRVIMPFYHPEIPLDCGVKHTAGILLYGPPGCRKTTSAHAIANETGVPFYKVSATELVSGVSGASEENIQELFSKADRTAPSIVFIDGIDAIASKRENSQRGMELRIVTQLMTCMDESCRLIKSVHDNGGSESSNSKPGYVLVIGATNRPDDVDPALRRPGLFDREIALGVPDECARVEILSVLTHNIKVEGASDLGKVARFTPGFVGADFEKLVNEAANIAMDRIIDKRIKKQMNGPHSEDWWRPPLSDEERNNLLITMADFEGLGLDTETGLLLYGPPGCGKTLIAKAVANEAAASFMHIQGLELLNKYVGESELAVRTIFSRARTCSPFILFFDEVDALTTKHDIEGEGVVGRLLKQQLIELNGAEQRRGVIGATNRMENGEYGQSESRDKIITIYSDFMARITQFEELVSTGSKLLFGFQQALGFLGRPPIDKTSTLVERIITAHGSRTVSSYVEAGCVNSNDSIQNLSKSKNVMDGLQCLLDDAACIVLTTKKKDEDVICSSDPVVSSSDDEEVLSSDLSKPEVEDYATTMAIIYSMVKQDYEMQVRVASSLNYKSSPGELETYCRMWSLRPFIDDDIMHRAWALVPKP